MAFKFRNEQDYDRDLERFYADKKQGKGARPRPYDHKAYAETIERIFGKKKSFEPGLYMRKNGKLVKLDKIDVPREIQDYPYYNPLLGKIVTSPGDYEQKARELNKKLEHKKIPAPDFRERIRNGERGQFRKSDFSKPFSRIIA
ncbi:MAG: hypothetical protein WC505_07155 [Patescibacteria group bacterium]